MAKTETKVNADGSKTVTAMRYPPRLKNLASLVARAQLASTLGYSFGNERDLYAALGYKRTLDFDDYYAQYMRGDIAKAVVNNPVFASWRLHPVVAEVNERDTEFEVAWNLLVKQLQIYQKFVRLDILTGIGQYGVLLLGLDDVKKKEDFAKPVKGTNLSLLYLHPYSEKNAVISDWVQDTKDPRYGKPEMYRVTTTVGESKTDTFKVHHSRVIHAVENPLENDVYGTPRLQCVFNRLVDLEKLLGGSAEMFWLGARPGYAAIADADAQFGDMDEEDMQEQLDEFDNHVRRWLQLKGVDIKDLAPQVSSPAEHVDVQFTAISAATGQPKRILIGSERGELASSQDERGWGYTISGRRVNYCEPVILRPFIDKAILYGILPSPKTEEYHAVWPDLITPSAEEKAKVGRIKSTTLKEYVTVPEAAGVVPPEMFLDKFVGFTHDEIEQTKEFLGGEFPKFEEREPSDEEVGPNSEVVEEVSGEASPKPDPES